MSTKVVDVAIVGGGPGGYVAGIRAGQLGRSALVIEREHLGGVCLNWGCIPSKALIHAANVKAEAEHLPGIQFGAPTIDAKALMAWKDGIVQKQRGGIKNLLQANKVEALFGEAKLTSTHTLEVKTASNGGKEEVRFSHLILATGARVIEIPGFPYDGELVGNARHAVSYASIPGRLTIIGGGVIGCELGMVYAKLGAKVTIVEMLPSILTGMDPDLVKPVLKTMKKLGVEVITEARAEGLTKSGGAAEVTIALKSGEKRGLPSDKVLVAVGFASNTKDLGLESAGVKTDARGFIPVDEQCKTNVPHIYAIGDATGAPLLAHRASKMGEIAAEVIAGHPAAYDVKAMPLGVFTDPEVAQVGLTEAEAKAKGLEVTTGSFPMAALGRAATMNATEGLVKIVVDKRTEVVVGIGIAAQNACDLIGEAALALEMGAVAEDLGLTVHTHPTLSEAIMEAAKAARGEAIHILNRRRERSTAAP